MMLEIGSWIEDYWGIEKVNQLKILYSFLTILILWIIRFLCLRLLFSKVTDLKVRYYWKNGIKNTYYVLVLLITASIWVDQVGSLATFFGLVTAGLAIALQDPIVNLAGWLFILIRRPFEVGDRIEIGEHSGDVIDVRFFQFTINEINNWVDADQSTGRIIHIPNGTVFKNPQANYTQGFTHIWNEISVLVTYESNWEKAKEIVDQIVKDEAESLSRAAKNKLLEASKDYMIFYTSLTPIVYTAIEESGIKLSMRYLINPRKRRMTEHRIWEQVLRKFKSEPDIKLAYQARRIYLDQADQSPERSS
ncbi:MAG: mechanosensitive ion channel family protein [Cyclobacteriaceae bacterium]